nr:fibronectin type III domain-containing protein [uncultured Psychroserpens sp.]
MKKITLFFVFAIMGALIFSSYAQTLNQNAAWPNTNWSVTGTYNTDPLAFEADPTVNANFAFDDDDAGNGSDDDIAAESPIIDLTAASNAGETWITISGNFVYNYNFDDTLQFEYWDADAGTWNIIGSPFDADTPAPPLNDFCTGTYEAYTTDILNIVGFTATQLSGFRYRIYFDDLVGGAGYEWGFCFDAPTITSATPPACPDPTALTVANITDSTADLAWTESGSATTWDIEIVISGTAPTGTATVTGVTNPYTVTGLMANTEYEYYVRSSCDANGTSAWVGPLLFRTACTAIVAPYTEDFETFTTAAAAFTSENCWTASGGTYYWESAPGTDAGSGGTGPDSTITTGNYFYTEASGGSAGDTTDLNAPLVDLSALTTPSLTFNYHMFGDQTGTIDVIVNGATSVFSISGQQQAFATTPWELAVIDLSAFAGQTIAVTFRATSAGTFEGDMAIDNVSFDELPACPTPNVLSATNITDTTADLAWSENGSSTVWDIEIVDVTAGETATGIPTETGVTNPYTVMGLLENNDYLFYVRSDCGAGTFSEWAGPFAFTTMETCPAPSGLTATAITETSADFGWTENGSSASWNIELVDNTAGETVTGTATATGVSNPYNQSGLVGDNSYSYYVQADCGVDGTSDWVGPFTFSTPYLAVDPDCTNGIFLDSGGVSSDYSSSETITYTICPDGADEVTSVEFTFFSTENSTTGCFDGLTIYNGADDSAPTIDPAGGGTIWCWDRDDATPSGTGDLQGMTITSTDASGCLTFVFTSDSSVTREGWEAIVSCNQLSVDDFENPAIFTYHPNPVKNTLTLNAQEAMSKVSIVNMLGQEVLSTSPNSLDSVIDMSQLQAGVYFINVTVNSASQTVRVVKE